MKKIHLAIFLGGLLSALHAQESLRAEDNAVSPRAPSASAPVAPAKTYQAPASTAEEPAAVQSPGKYLINPGDRLSFRIVEDREDSRPLQVTDTGEVDIPYIGRIVAAGKTCDQLATQVKPLLEKDYYIQATVIISLDSITKNKGKIYVTGQVRIQGPLEIPSDESFTVSKAILRAGGFGDFADKHKVKLIRKKPGAPANAEKNTTLVDVAEILEKGRTEKDPVLQPEDLIIVPQRLINF